MTKVGDVAAAVEAIAPLKLALDWDKVGLVSGSLDQPVQRLALALDATLAAVREAEKKQADMLLVHHPRFFHPLTTLSLHDASGRRAAAIAQSGIAVYAAHTNFDLAEGGTNDTLAQLAGLRNAEIVQIMKTEQLIKLAVFVPESHVEQVMRAVGDAGAGAIGKYSDCTFRTRGIGTFRCGETVKPFIGKPGSFEQVDEYRLETVFGEFARERVIAAMLAAHPYEEVAYDLYPLAVPAKSYGSGRVGELVKAETLGNLAMRMATATGSSMTQICGKAGRKVRRIAVWAGAGAEAELFAAREAEAVVAGEVGYHEVEAFSDAGIGLVTLGHGFSETPALLPLAARLGRLFPKLAVDVLGKTGFPMVNI